VCKEELNEYVTELETIVADGTNPKCKVILIIYSAVLAVHITGM